MDQPYSKTGVDIKTKDISNMSKLDNPGVRVPPPLVYLVAILIGVGLNRFVLARILPNGVGSWTGMGLVLLALALSALSLREFHKARTTIRPDRAASGLVTTGVFRYSRNPMYLSLAILQLGIGLWLNDAWVMLLLVPVIVWVRFVLIAREERSLKETFGQPYLDYQAKVHRWF